MLIISLCDEKKPIFIHIKKINNKKINIKMKYVLIALTLAFFFAGCEKEEINDDNNNNISLNKILYVEGVSSTNTGRLVTIDSDGSNKTEIRSFSSTSLGYAEWSPDASKIAFIYNPTGGGTGTATPEIYTLNSDGTSLTQLTNNAVSKAYCTYSPDGTKILYMEALSGGGAGLFTINPDGTNKIQITSFPSMAPGYPSWSPDGSKIAFIYGPSGPAQVYTINSDGTLLTQLTNSTNSKAYCAYSPDGTKILYMESAPAGAGAGFYTVKSDGTNNVEVRSFSTAVLAFPTWSPDGTKIAFLYNPTSTGTGAIQIYTITSAGMLLTQLTNDTNNKAFCVWK